MFRLRNPDANFKSDGGHQGKKGAGWIVFNAVIFYVKQFFASVEVGSDAGAYWSTGNSQSQSVIPLFILAPRGPLDGPIYAEILDYLAD